MAIFPFIATKIKDEATYPVAWGCLSITITVVTVNH
jgi:hypothetical protein